MSKISDTINGLRFQIYDTTGEIHIHDDAKGLKFIGDRKEFKEDFSSALKDLSKKPSTILIQGKSDEQLCLINDGSKYSVSVIKLTNLIGDLRTFSNKL